MTGDKSTISPGLRLAIGLIAMVYVAIWVLSMPDVVPDQISLSSFPSAVLLIAAVMLGWRGHAETVFGLLVGCAIWSFVGPPFVCMIDEEFVLPYGVVTGIVLLILAYLVYRGIQGHRVAKGLIFVPLPFALFVLQMPVTWVLADVADSHALLRAQRTLLRDLGEKTWCAVAIYGSIVSFLYVFVLAFLTHRAIRRRKRAEL
ncbi:MAG: hypothetical protein PVJ57_10545 [Phycisphaerae bacterium]